jgi:hypothetical protein
MSNFDEDRELLFTVKSGPSGHTQWCRAAAKAGAGRQGAGCQRQRSSLPGCPEGQGFTIDPAKVEADAQFDGLFVLRTNMQVAATAVVLHYHNLPTMEQSFLASKALFATRPVFHRTDAAIRGHIFCTFLALVLREELLDRLAARGTAPWQYIIDDLADSARSRSNRIAAERCYESPRAPASTRSAALRGWPCHLRSRRCHRARPSPTYTETV